MFKGTKEFLVEVLPTERHVNKGFLHKDNVL